MGKLKKSISFVLIFLTVFSSFTILPNEFLNLADVSAVDLSAKESNGEKTNLVKSDTEEATEGDFYAEGDYTYSVINDEEVAIVDYIGTSTDIVIPDVITNSNIPVLQNKKITAIEEDVFRELELTSITFGKYIKSIGRGACRNNAKLEKVDLSKCVNLEIICDYAFYENTQLIQVDLPASDKLTTIGKYAFSRNYVLEEIDLSLCKGLTTIGNSAFESNYKMPSTLCLENIETIGQYAFSKCTYLTYLEIGNNLRKIEYRAFYCNEYLTNVTIKGGKDAVIEDEAFACPTSEYPIGVENLTIGNGVRTIGDSAFEHCGLCDVIISDTVVSFGDYAMTIVGDSEITIGKGVVAMGRKAIHGANFKYSANIKILSENLVVVDESIPTTDTTITCYKNSETHKTLENKGYSNMLKFFNLYIPPTDIKVNGVSVSDFKYENKEYTVIVDDIADVNITPVFESDDVKYEITSEDNIYTINVYNEADLIADTYKITVNEKAPEPKYTVIGDVTLMLNSISATKVGGSVALPKGTYRLKLAKGDIEFGYSKRVTDYCSVTLSDKYKGFITLDTTGGTYTFQFDTKTNKLIIKHDSNLPNEYLIGDLNTILKPVGDRPLSIGTQQLSKGTYKFKLSIGGKEFGYNKIVDNATSGSLSMNSKYTAQVTLNATGGMYTFILNTETNKLIIRHTPTGNEAKNDVHISGTFNLVLNDKSETGEDLTIATGTTYLEDGCYTFKVYNYGTVYTAGLVINDNGKRTLSSQYTTPITLNATGGNYNFVFDKETGVFEVSLVE